MLPNRYSRPMTAPLSRPNRSPAKSPKSPAAGGRPKRWVTRNALLNLGSRSEVGNDTSVKSGSAGSRTASSSWARAGVTSAVVKMNASSSRTVGRITCAPVRNASVPGGAVVDPAPDDLDLSRRQVRRAVERHANADDTRTSFDLVDHVARVGVAGGHPHNRGLLEARDVDELIIGYRMFEVQPAGPCTVGGVVAVDTRGAARRVGGLEHVVLDAGECRLEIGRRSGDRRQALVAGAD